MAVLQLREMQEMVDMAKMVEIDLLKLDWQVVRDVVDAAARTGDLGHAETARWFYNVPFPGVWYYSYEDSRRGPVR